jgi:phosphate transport system substrate-binding protein
VNWPTGTGASGSAGVAGVVSNTPGALCYVDTAFAVSNHLHFASIKNAAGNFINPSIRNVAAAGDSVKSNNELHVVNPPKSSPTAYPISTFTYIIVQLKTSLAAQLRKMIFWALTTDQQSKYTAKLWFAPIPHPVLVASEKTMRQIQTG